MHRARPPHNMLDRELYAEGESKPEAPQQAAHSITRLGRMCLGIILGLVSSHTPMPTLVNACTRSGSEWMPVRNSSHDMQPSESVSKIINRLRKRVAVSISSKL
mmetsp:Transcript_123485/g.394955  ORF Transcript_123485/g.394955 Transcript_123485/m.394955 type:complete len:104 (-) Transcript_123485:1977-2288(-)